MKTYRYYSVRRPIGPGTFPKNSHVVSIVNFNDRIYCDGVNRPAWGYIEYDKPLSDKDARDYELLRDGLRKFFSVIVRENLHEDRGIASKLGPSREDYERPADNERSGRNFRQTIKWFNTEEEAIAYCSRF